uniref:Proton-coupled folate transporter n=1 Tax=Romanomermis culicivorax TaxID=13658 RepID=A0A915I9L9_ROMCU
MSSISIKYRPEPTIFLASVGVGVNIALCQALITYRLCAEKLNIFETTCFGQASISDRYEIEVQASQYGVYAQIASSVPALISCVNLSVWSDINGRKPPILLTLFGLAIQNIFFIAVSTFSFLPLWLILVGNAICGCLGHCLMLFSCCFSMITDIVKDQKKLTIELGLASSLIFAGIVCGSLLSKLVVEIMPPGANYFNYAFLLSVLSIFLAFLYAVVILSDSKSTSANSTMKKTEPGDQNVEKKAPAYAIVQCLNVILKPRPNNTRCLLITTSICFLIAFSCDIGMVGLQFLYLSNEPFLFDAAAYSEQLSIQTSASALGLFFIPFLFKGIFNITNDLWLIFVGVLVSMAKSFFFAFAYNYCMILIFSMSYFGSSVLLTGFRAFCSKLVEDHETGKCIGRLFAILSSLELLAPLLSGASFNVLYSYTVAYFAGLTWIVAGIVLLFVLIILWFVHVDMSKRLMIVDDDQVAIMNSVDS